MNELNEEINKTVAETFEVHNHSDIVCVAIMSDDFNSNVQRNRLLSSGIPLSTVLYKRIEANSLRYTRSNPLCLLAIPSDSDSQNVSSPLHHGCLPAAAKCHRDGRICMLRVTDRCRQMAVITHQSSRLSGIHICFCRTRGAALGPP